MSILSFLKPDNKVLVGVSVSPNVGVEMLMVDPVQRKVTKYAQRPLGYNASTREIEDYAEFKTALGDLFRELDLDPKSVNVVLNLPNVGFGHAHLPTILDNDGVDGALVAQVEENYLFKKNTPVVSWVEVNVNNTSDKRYIVYTAMQEEVLGVITQVFEELGATLIAVENTYSSLIKTLEFTRITDDFATSGGSWNILLVSQNSYAVFSMLDYRVIDYYEDPLAIRSFNNDEVYVAIAQSASMVLEKFASDKLLVVSESNDVNAEILSMQLKLHADIKFLDANHYAKVPLIDVDLNVLPHYIKAITPEAIGAAIYRAKDFKTKFNFIKQAEVKTTEMVEVFGHQMVKEQLYLVSMLIAAVLAGLGWLAANAIGTYSSTLESNKSSLEQQQASLQAELKKYRASDNKQSIYSIAKTIDKSMVTELGYYNSIGSAIPNKVWLTSFYTDSKGGSGMEGATTSVDDVYIFFRGIKSQVADSNLVLSKLSVDDSDGMIDIEVTPNANYTFALTNPGYKKPSTQAADSAKAAVDGVGGQGAGMSVPNLPNLPN